MQEQGYVPYGTARDFVFELWDVSGKAYTGVLPISGDISLIKDGTLGATTLIPTAIGSGLYSLSLGTADLEAKEVIVQVKDQDVTEVFMQSNIRFLTDGHASADRVDSLATISSDLGTISTDVLSRSTQVAVDQVLTDLGVVGTNVLDRSTQVSVDQVLTDLGVVGTNVLARATQTSVTDIQTDVTTILGDTGTTIPGLITALNNIAAADVLTSPTEGSETLAETIRLLRSVMLGVSAASDTQVIYQNAAGTAPRVTVSLDENNRTIVSTDAS